MIPFSVHEAKAIKNKTSPNASHALTSSNETNRIPYSSQSNTASPGGCINYNPSTRTITVSCSNPARLTDIANKLMDITVLTKQSPDGTWFLSANLVIAKGASFSIDSTDTKWLKISSEKATAGTVSPLPYNIDVHGSLKIDSVKVTSWDPATNNYSITNGSREAVSPGTKGATANDYI